MVFADSLICISQSVIPVKLGLSNIVREVQVRTKVTASTRLCTDFRAPHPFLNFFRWYQIITVLKCEYHLGNPHPGVLQIEIRDLMTDTPTYGNSLYSTADALSDPHQAVCR